MTLKELTITEWMGIPKDIEKYANLERIEWPSSKPDADSHYIAKKTIISTGEIICRCSCPDARFNRDEKVDGPCKHVLDYMTAQ